MKPILIPLPERDFDVTEVAVPYRLLRSAGHVIHFATERGGATPAADPLLLSGVIFGQLGAEPEPRAFYHEMTRAAAFQRPLSFASLASEDYAGVLLPGGHAPQMRPYLESAALQRLVAAFFQRDQPVAAICHGVLVAARTRDTAGRSVLFERRTTCLPKYMERAAYYLTAWRLGRYYRTYPAYVEEEVRAALCDPSRFVRGPLNLVARGTALNDRPAFVVEDGRYLSARWPGDAYLFARRFDALLKG